MSDRIDLTCFEAALVSCKCMIDEPVRKEWRMIDNVRLNYMTGIESWEDKSNGF